MNAVRRSRGFTVVELAVVCSMIAILTAMAIPIVKYSMKRQNEMELRYELRLMRDAIDKYKQYADDGQIQVAIGTRGVSAGPGDARRGRRPRRAAQQEAEVPAAHPDRPDDEEGRVGAALLPGRARLDVLGRTERLRRVLASPAPGRPTGRTTRTGDEVPKSEQHGFTLLELLVVMTIIGILAAIAVPALRDSPQRAREATLREDLFTLRSVIDQYHGDKGVFPPDLQTLVTDGYLRKIPVDPMTKSAETWVLTTEEIHPTSRIHAPPSPSRRASPTSTAARPSQGARRNAVQGMVIAEVRASDRRLHPRRARDRDGHPHDPARRGRTVDRDGHEAGARGGADLSRTAVRARHLALPAALRPLPEHAEGNVREPAAHDPQALEGPDVPLRRLEAR